MQRRPHAVPSYPPPTCTPPTYYLPACMFGGLGGADAATRGGAPRVASPFSAFFIPYSTTRTWVARAYLHLPRTFFPQPILRSVVCAFAGSIYAAAICNAGYSSRNVDGCRTAAGSRCWSWFDSVDSGLTRLGSGTWFSCLWRTALLPILFTTGARRMLFARRGRTGRRRAALVHPSYRTGSSRMV